MKYTRSLIWLTAAAASLAVAAPEIAPERIDAAVRTVLQQGGEAAAGADGKVIRNQVTRQLQTLEVLKNEALKLGLDKDPEVQIHFKNMEAEFYAGQYTEYLQKQIEVSDAELRRFYDRKTLLIQLQEAAFPSEAAAQEALALLRKGLSFDELAKRYPSAEPTVPDHLFSPESKLPEPLQSVVENLNRGEVTREPVKLGDRFYLFKLSKTDRVPEAPPFELVRHELVRLLKEEQVAQQLKALLKANGLDAE
ncbi:peptidyl-prolyl cis-trans isomerase [Neisseria sp. ZJ106]|uniref:peptidylprolyl isomerase n=1 Tax=Neisseria lisongii TaxID=2912188 RepID=A0ABY7RI59_9NEIS|nr:peptidylprolyl isomerase [Neisseria lisongii]MCF7521909.1 peptidyl-prolyl cis-trans isomerase [Neisseria lisongii]WCL71128.1 peptidylprolyl isomerase [Neisseria lisongii]